MKQQAEFYRLQMVKNLFNDILKESYSGSLSTDDLNVDSLEILIW
jgi:hypothetical protein